jgi:hypothetical protein
MTTARLIAVALERKGLPVVRPERGEILVLGRDVNVVVGEAVVSVDFHDYKRQAVHEEILLEMGIDYVMEKVMMDCKCACSLYPC